MDAIIICGGKGTRVRTITNDEIPKIMIPVNGRPFVEYLIETLYSMGVRNIVFAAGFRGDILQGYCEWDRKLRSDSIPWSHLSVLIEDEPLGTGGAILNALDKTGYGLHSDPFLVINGDCLILPSQYDEWDCYEHIYYKECWDEPECAMFTCKLNHDGRYGSLGLAPYNPFSGGMEFITGFENGRPGESWINCGWYLMRREFFDCCRDEDGRYEIKNLSMEKDIFPVYLEEGNVINAIMINEEQFLEIGTPEALAHTERRLKELKEF